jgi:hypothetical protein
MEKTKQIPSGEWQSYFDRLSRAFMSDETPETVTVEVLSPRMGDQIEAQTARLQGISYDPKSQALEVWMEDLDHLTFQPSEIWVIEQEGGFISAVEIKQSDGQVQLLYLHRSGPLARRYDQPVV